MNKTIKVKKKMNFKELLEYISTNDIRTECYLSDEGQEINVLTDGTIAFEQYEYNCGETYVVEVEKEITEDSTLDNLEDLISIWAVNRNLHTADSSKQALKLGEEYGELCEGISKGKPELIKDALGDMFVVMTILAMQEDLDLIECVEMAYNEIKDRKGKMIDGVFVKEADL